MLFRTGNQKYGSPTVAFNFLRSPVFLQDMLQTTVNSLLHNPSPKFLQEMLLAQTFSPVSFGQSLSPRNALSSFHLLKSFLQFHLLKVFLQDIPGVRFARSNFFSNFTCPKPFCKIFLPPQWICHGGKFNIFKYSENELNDPYALIDHH